MQYVYLNICTKFHNWIMHRQLELKNCKEDFFAIELVMIIKTKPINKNFYIICKKIFLKNVTKC